MAVRMEIGGEVEVVKVALQYGLDMSRSYPNMCRLSSILSFTMGFMVVLRRLAAPFRAKVCTWNY